MKWFKGILIFPILLALILALFFAFYIKGLESSNQKIARKVVSTVDMVLSQGEQAGRYILKRFAAPPPCDEVLPSLRELVTTLPYVRSLHIGDGKKIYCSSFLGPVNVIFTSSDYKNKKLELLSSSLVQSRHPVIMLKTSSNNVDVLSAVDGVFISNILAQQEDDELGVFFNIGNEWLSKQGSISWAEPNNYQVGIQRVESAKYPFSVFVAYQSTSPLSTFIKEQWPFILVIVFAYSVLFYIIVKLLNRPYSLHADMKRALMRNEFVPYAQKVVHAGDGSVSGIEILMRWAHPTQGLVRPDLFIPHAEDSGLIVQMTRALFKDTAQTLVRYKEYFPDHFHVGINIAAPHFKDPHLLQDCIDFIKVVNSPRLHLALELTERYSLDMNGETIELFNKLREAGVEFAIDDFGTGHSSLGYFKKCQMSFIKIDKSFVSQIGNDSISESLIDNIIDLAKRMKLGIIAEGVETPEQVKRLKEMHVEYLQGFLFSKPLPLEDVLNSLPKRID